MIFSGDVTDWSAITLNLVKSLHIHEIHLHTYSKNWYEFWRYRNTEMAGMTPVAKNPNGIGYVGLAYIKHRESPIDRIGPTSEHIR